MVTKYGYHGVMLLRTVTMGMFVNTVTSKGMFLLVTKDGY